MKTSKLSIIALAIVAGAFTSCKKHKQEAPAPKDGNANVHSFTFTTNSSAWTQSNNNFNALLTVESISTDILSKGSVNVFLGDGTGYNWTAMPVTIKGLEYSYSIYLHTVQISVTLTSDNNSSLSNPGVQQFKVVVIEGAARAAHPNVNMSNYDEVRKTFQLIN